jgi:hypothetical protein
MPTIFHACTAHAYAHAVLTSHLIKYRLIPGEGNLLNEILNLVEEVSFAIREEMQVCMSEWSSM